MRIENITVKSEAYTSEAARYLIGMLDNGLIHRFPGKNSGSEPSQNFGHDKSTFLVARNDGVPIACGGLVYVDDETCEIKCMFTEPCSRGRGVAKKVLQALEKHAIEQGFKIIQLETGRHQPEAIIMYEHNGYQRIPCFRQYVGNPHSCCYEKRIIL